jgi:hypothetical protein
MSFRDPTLIHVIGSNKKAFDSKQFILALNTFIIIMTKSQSRRTNNQAIAVVHVVHG